MNGSISRLEYNLHSVLSLKGGGDKSRKSFEITQIAKLNLIILRGLRLRSIFTRAEEYLFIYLFFFSYFITLSFPLFDQSNIYFYLTLSFSLLKGEELSSNHVGQVFSKDNSVKKPSSCCIVTFKILIKIEFMETIIK